ncbi:marR family protein [Asticcacaulis biprosthecium C19]|uniref:MarR family protein n=1 Tax=Asticcacaulis biprosthecium C19 TaxID=715226 RepID=F4QRQ4_9CAUL|nr:marR family protein [Asticcacaulis biprosthecium C19]
MMIATDRLRFQIETSLRPVGINLTQMSLLNHFSWRPDHAQSITELTEVMAINQPGVTKAVAALADKGLVEKIDSAEDARVKQVKITAKGLDVLNQARRAAYPPVEAAFGQLDDGELAAFVGHLRKMKAYLTE